MSFFSKLSKNFHHGGVKIALQAPGGVSLQDAELPVTVSLTASEAATIKSVRVQMLATPKNMAFSGNGVAQDDVMRNQQSQQRVVAMSQMSEPFTMAAGETKAVQLNIIMNSGNFAAGQSGDSQAMAAIAKVAGTLQTLSGLANHEAYSYSLQASADVDGIALDPSATIGISVNAPGQFGSTTTFQL